MELTNPDQIALSETTNALIEDVEETALRVNDHRPLPQEVVTRIDDELLGERVYSSNAIEGSTLELRETIMILKHGVGGSTKKREAREAENLGKAIRQITEWLGEHGRLYDVARLLQVHELILKGIKPEWAGRFRTDRVMIGGAKHQPPDHSIVPALVERVMEHASAPTKCNHVVRAVWVHWALARIHPFYDGNGRIARLWQDVVLLQGQLTCAIIRPEDRGIYLDSLGDADDGDFNPLVQLISQRVLATLDKYLVELGRTAEFTDWVREVAGEVDERAAEHAKLAYQRWRRAMERLRREFELCAGKLSETSDTLQMQVQTYPIIEQLQWENIRSGLGASKTWHFRLDCSTQGRRHRYYFFFGQHYWGKQDDERDRSQQRVSLLISEDDGSGKGNRLDEISNCPLSIREVFVVDDAFVCRRVDPATGRVEYQRNMPALRIAQDFIREVVLQRLT